VSLVQTATRRIREEVDVSAWGSRLPDAIQQEAQDRVAQAAPLVRRKHRHIDDVEVPAPIPEQAPHADDFAAVFHHDMAGSPTATQRSHGLLIGLWGKPCFAP
jgi:hypothetical protein